MRHVVRVADLTGAEVEDIMARARQARTEVHPICRPLVVGLIFLAPSTRTRFGFAAAVARLGGHALMVPEVRPTGVGLPPESVADTVRVISGMSDIVVCRPAGDVEMSSLVAAAVCPLVNGGDAREHPTQALIDRFAIETLAGPPSELHIGISGDLRTRAARSMLQSLRVVPPRQLSLFAPPGREAAIADLPAELVDRTVHRTDPDFSELDVLLLPGLAPGQADIPLAADAHLRWGFSPVSAPSLPSGAIVLSPGPVIDEIDPSCADDPRVRVFEQSDLGGPARIGFLQWLLDSEVGP